MENDEYFMRLALNEAGGAFEEGEIPVGAVLVLEDKVIASAHNSKEATGDPTAHAEVLAIQNATAKSGEWRLTKATLYVTKEPCVMCAGAMINARLGKLVYGCKDKRFGAVNSRHQLLHDPGLNHQVRVVPGILEDECAELLKKFFKMRRSNHL
jgi:tRNA(adenine34) deaminase